MAEHHATGDQTCRVLVSPTGKEILGTKELLIGRAEIVGFDANDAPIYEGTTTIFWDDAAIACVDGKFIYLDKDGAEWTFDQLIAVGGEKSVIGNPALDKLSTPTTIMLNNGST